jgi:hypothetical protein
MGKKKAVARGAPAAAVEAASPRTAGRRGVGGGGPSFGGAEAGLCVRRQPGAPGLAYLSGLTFGVLVLLGTQLALAPTLPRLLCHWSWTVFTLFGAALVVCRWAKEETVAAYLLFWGLLMVNGLSWLALLLVPSCGVLPGSLWQAYGEHGGDHLAIASLGSVPLLLAPTVLITLFMWFERAFLAAIYHDVTFAMDGWFTNLVWQLFCPAIPLAFWAAFLRPPLFGDLPQWPGIAPVLCISALLNVRAPRAHRRSLRAVDCETRRRARAREPRVRVRARPRRPRGLASALCSRRRTDGRLPPCGRRPSSCTRTSTRAVSADRRTGSVGGRRASSCRGRATRARTDARAHARRTA